MSSLSLDFDLGFTNEREDLRKLGLEGREEVAGEGSIGVRAHSVFVASNSSKISAEKARRAPRACCLCGCFSETRSPSLALSSQISQI